MFHRFRTLLAVCTVALMAACGGNDDGAEYRNIVEVAADNPDLSILVEAVTAAGLVDELSGPGPLTVFAPTNAAFELLLKDLNVTKEELLADTDLLTTVLTYHVVAGAVRADDVPLGKSVTTLQGGIFKVDSVSGDLVITDGRNRTSTITDADVEATNGVIHVIDRVLLPANKNIVETAQSNPNFSILVEAVIAAGLVDALSGPEPLLTVFAPTNAAFEALLTELNITKDQLFANVPLLTEVLTYHVVAGRVLKADVPVGAPIATLQGDTFTVDNTLAITDQRARKSNIVITDVLASNGVIHAIDKVILPAP